MIDDHALPAFASKAPDRRRSIKHAVATQWASMRLIRMPGPLTPSMALGG
jgi:hypothetical protein